MNWKAKRPAIEIAAESMAVALFGGAITFAVWSLAPLGAGPVALGAASLVGLAGLVAAWLVMGRVDAKRASLDEQFVPVDFSAEPDVLLLDDPIDDEPPLFEDSLPAVTEESRVVQLFAAPAPGGDASPLPAPGEMVARIEDFLGGTRVGTAASHRAPVDPDASAALHAALADIRRSLRQG